MTKLLASYALAAMAFAAAPQAVKAADTDGQCPKQNATLLGTYMSHGMGTIIGVGPITAVGTITYDGKGNLSNPYTASVNGTIFRGVTATGTYTVNSDCTGSATQANGTQHFDFVVSPDGSRVYWIETDSGTVLSGSAVRLKPRDAEAEARMGSQNRDAVQGPLDGAARESVEIEIRLQHLEGRIGPSKAPNECCNRSV